MATLFIGPLVDFERKLGYESTIVTSIHSTKYGNKIIPYDLSIRNFLLIPYSFIRICIFLIKSRPNLIVSHNSRSSLIPLLAARFTRVKYGIYFNHGVPSLGYKGFIHFLLNQLEALNLFLAWEVITVSQDMKNELSKINAKVKISLVNNGSASGINLEMYDHQKYDKSLFRKKHGLNDDDFLAVYVGRPEKRKGFEVVIDLWATHFLSSRYKLILCGPEESHVKNIIDRVPDNIICMGFCNYVPEILMDANCLILPSLHEGLSYAVLEAMASKCIPIANNIKGISELIDDGINGFLVNDNAIQDYKDVIVMIDNMPKSKLCSLQEKALEKSKDYCRNSFLKAYHTRITSIFDANQLR